MIIEWTLLMIALFISIGICFWITCSLIGLIRAKGVPYVPLWKRQLDKVGEHIKLSPEDKVIDLGCGDARVLRMFEKQGVKTLVGYEVSFWAYLMARFYNFLFRSKNKVYYKNFFNVDISGYNVVFCYLLDSALANLRGKFDKELKPGAMIVSYGFEIKDWHRPEKIIYTNKVRQDIDRIFVYII